jgi:glyoxylase-like metal-dependent hydrolase (beta-lactamase superfamily II)
MSAASFGLFPTGNAMIRQVKVPVPYPLKYVNSYLISGDNGWTVIDPGIHTQDALETWDAVWAGLGGGYRDVERIVLTHHHPDHYGLAGWFQEKSGAPVFLSEWGKRQADRMWGDERSQNEELWRLFVRHGMDRSVADAMIPHMESFVALVSPRPEIALIRDGEALRLGNETFEAVETGGHAAGHLSFYRKQSGEMFCGDAVLPHISPNISYVPGVETDSLSRFLDGLRLLGTYRVERAYPGHREPFESFTERCAQLVVHHEKRLELIFGIIQEEGRNAYDVCIRLFGTRLTVHQMRFAMSETLAHLIHLELQGRVRRGERGGADYFEAV